MTANAASTLIAAHWGIAEVRQTAIGLRLVPVEGDERPSARMADYLASRDSDERLTHPLVREGYLRAVREGRDPAETREGRGLDPMVEVSWEEAITLAADAIRRTYAEHGPSAVWGRSYGWKNAGEVNNPIGLLRRFLNLQGGFVETFNSYSTAAIGAIQKVIAGAADPEVPPLTDVVEHAERVVLWGADPVVTNDIAWNTTLHDTAHAFEAMKSREGLEVIAINPLRPETLHVTGGRWVAPYPGTDGALALGLIHTLFTEGLADREFLNTRTTGARILEGVIEGHNDGVVRDARWASAHCGIPAEEIRALARELASHRTMIMLGWGPQRARYGESTVWAIWALAAVLGQIGGRGTGIGTRYHYSSGGGRPSDRLGLFGIPTRVDPVVPVTNPDRCARPLPVAGVADVLLHPGKSIRCGGIDLTYPDIRLVFWAGGNPFGHHPDTGRLTAAFRRPDTVIVSDVFKTGTVAMADIVFAASHPTERNDITGIGVYAPGGIVRSSKVFEPLGESLSDFEIFRRLAQKLDLEVPFTEGLDENGWARRLYDEACEREARRGFHLPDWETFEVIGLVQFPEGKRQSTPIEAFVSDPIEAPLATESGRLMLASPLVTMAQVPDCPGHPAWLEVPVKEGCFRLITPKSVARLHSQLDPVTRQTRDIAGCEPCWIHPADAARLGISSGNRMRLVTPRGSVEAGALVTDRVRPGVLVLRHGAWLDAIEGGLRLDLPSGDAARLHCQHGAANVLTIDQPTSGWSWGNTASVHDVTVERI